MIIRLKTAEEKIFPRQTVRSAICPVCYPRGTSWMTPSACMLPGPVFRAKRVTDYDATLEPLDDEKGNVYNIGLKKENRKQDQFRYQLQLLEDG